MLCWIFPRSRKAHAWRRHSGLAMASHCTGFRSAARTSVPARLGGARSSMRTFRPAAPGSTSRTPPARNPCRAHNDWVQPWRPQEGLLTDGVVSLRPVGRDARSRMMPDRFASGRCARHRLDPLALAVRAWGRPESASACEGSQQAQSAGALDCLGSPVRAELGVEMAYVGSDCVPRDMQFIRDLRCRQVGRQVAQLNGPAVPPGKLDRLSAVLSRLRKRPVGVDDRLVRQAAELKKRRAPAGCSCTATCTTRSSTSSPPASTRYASAPAPSPPGAASPISSAGPPDPVCRKSARPNCRRVVRK
jgi:hypothetical protein